jgi:hypothetical protein
MYSLFLLDSYSPIECSKIPAQEFRNKCADTSRARGEGEIDGVDYHFVSRVQFESMVAKNMVSRARREEEADRGTTTSCPGSSSSQWWPKIW